MLDDTFAGSSFNQFPIAPSHSGRSRVAHNGSAKAVDRAQVFARNARADGTAVRTRQVARQGLPRRNKASVGVKQRSIYLCTRPEPLPPIKDSISDRVE
jgi:hypothetical protein